MNVTDYERVIVEAEKEFVDKGKLIEAGWAGLRATWLPPDASPRQVKAMRYAFFAGAQHLFSSIMNVLEADQEPTDDDMRRMMLIAKELAAFYDEVHRELPTEGSA